MRRLLPAGPAVVTGAASGVGLAVARVLAAQGVPLALCDQNAPGLEASAAEIRSRGAAVWWAKVDVASAVEVNSFAKEAIDRLGPPGTVVNAAGVAALGLFHEIDPDVFQRVIDVNLLGIVNVCRAFLPTLLARRAGHVVNIASLAGLCPAPFATPYTASKYAVVGFSEALRAELAPFGVGVTVVCPARVRTDIARSSNYYGRFQSFRPLLVASLETGGQDPNAVARAILTAIRRNRSLVVGGVDARFLFAIKRALPHASARIVSAIARLVLRRLERRQGAGVLG